MSYQIRFASTFGKSLSQAPADDTYKSVLSDVYHLPPFSTPQDLRCPVPTDSHARNASDRYFGRAIFLTNTSTAGHECTNELPRTEQAANGPADRSADPQHERLERVRHDRQVGGRRVYRHHGARVHAWRPWLRRERRRDRNDHASAHNGCGGSDQRSGAASTDSASLNDCTSTTAHPGPSTCTTANNRHTHTTTHRSAANATARTNKHAKRNSRTSRHLLHRLVGKRRCLHVEGCGHDEPSRWRRPCHFCICLGRR